jgi:hypothetical protein
MNEDQLQMWIQKDRLANYPLGTDFNGNED